MYSYWAQSCLLIFPILWSCCWLLKINKTYGNLVFQSFEAHLPIQLLLCFPICISYVPFPILLNTAPLTSAGVAPQLCFLHWINYYTCIKPKKNYDWTYPFRKVYSCLCSPRLHLHVLASSLSLSDWLVLSLFSK